MKVALASDVHLEFGDLDIQNTENADVLILSGDILIADDLASFKQPDGVDPKVFLSALSARQERALMFRNFLSRCSDLFKDVVYVAGNHEFYHGKFPAHIDVLREECAKFSNIHYMEMDNRKIGDVTFVGCTLWTDMNKGDPMTLHAIQSMMNDYSIIRNSDLGYTKLRPAHTAEHHRKSFQYIKEIVDSDKDGTFVVVTHMAPSTKSIHPRYVHDRLMNGAYSSDLSELIMDRPQIKLWTHGHVHDPFDYMVGETRIACNPRGYVGYEVRDGDFQLKFMDV
jgi:Icc-related predicted phosphoesterase